MIYFCISLATILSCVFFVAYCKTDFSETFNEELEIAKKEEMFLTKWESKDNYNA